MPFHTSHSFQLHNYPPQVLWSLAPEQEIGTRINIVNHHVNVETSVGLVPSFLDTIQNPILRISHFLIPVGYGYLAYFHFRSHSGLYTLQDPSHLGKIALISIWFRMVVTQLITPVYKDSHTLRYSPNIDIWLVLKFWYPRVGSLISFLILIINTIHSPSYRSNNVWNQLCEFSSSLHQQQPKPIQSLHVASEIKQGLKKWVPYVWASVVQRLG
jgi:hypothetical protein